MRHSAKVTAVSNKLNAQAMLNSNAKGIPGSGPEHPQNVLIHSFAELQELINRDV